jgi:hypothetical protein
MSTVAEIARLEQAVADAMLASDRPALEPILAPEFRLVGNRSTGSGDLIRSAWLDAVPKLKVHEISIWEPRVEAYGDTAIASVDGHWRIEWRGETFEERFLLTDVWLRRDGAWQLVRCHFNPYPAGD